MPDSHESQSTSQKQDNDSSVARWTQVLGFFQVILAVGAIASAVVACQQLNVMRGQLKEMQLGSRQIERSLDAANRQASATEAANKIASEAVISSNRPWVGLGSVTSAKPAAGQPYKVTVTLINSGHEPALDVRGEVFLTIEANGEIEKKITPDCTFCSHTVTLPNSNEVASLELDASTISAELVEDIELGRKLFLVRSTYRYTGAHEDPHTTNICVVYDPKTASFPNCQTGNEVE